MRSRIVELSAPVVIVVAGMALVVVYYYGGSPGDPEGWIAAIGFGSPFIGMGFLGLIGSLRQRPTLVLAAAVGVATISLISPVLLPLLIPAAAMAIQAARQDLNPQYLAVSGLLVLAPIGSLGFLVFHQDPASWRTADGGGSSSNIVTGTEAALTITTAVVVNLIAAIPGSLPPRRKPFQD